MLGNQKRTKIIDIIEYTLKHTEQLNKFATISVTTQRESVSLEPLMKACHLRTWTQKEGGAKWSTPTLKTSAEREVYVVPKHVSKWSDGVIF